MMVFNGVRSSWLTDARNTLLVRLASIASSLATADASIAFSAFSSAVSSSAENNTASTSNPSRIVEADSEKMRPSIESLAGTCESACRDGLAKTCSNARSNSRA